MARSVSVNQISDGELSSEFFPNVFFLNYLNLIYLTPSFHVEYLEMPHPARNLKVCLHWTLEHSILGEMMKIRPTLYHELLLQSNRTDTCNFQCFRVQTCLKVSRIQRIVLISLPTLNRLCPLLIKWSYVQKRWRLLSSEYVSKIFYRNPPLLVDFIAKRSRLTKLMLKFKQNSEWKMHYEVMI